MTAERHQASAVAGVGCPTGVPFSSVDGGAASALVLPALIPAMMCRWKTRNSATMGMLAITIAAISTVSWMFCDSCTRATLMGCLSVSENTISGHRKSCHTATSAKIDTTPSTGRDMGSTIDHRVRSLPAPSISAASRTSLGSWSKNRLSRYRLKALATAGSQMASGSLSRPRSATVRYFGTTRAWAGTISVARMPPRIRVPKAGRSLDRA